MTKKIDQKIVKSEVLEPARDSAAVERAEIIQMSGGRLFEVTLTDRELSPRAEE